MGSRTYLTNVRFPSPNEVLYAFIPTDRSTDVYLFSTGTKMGKPNFPYGITVVPDEHG